MIVLHPVSAPPPPVSSAQSRLEGLTGRTLGFLGNNKPNADVLLASLAARLHERFGVVSKQVTKTVPSLAAPEPLLAELRRDCEGVVLAVYD